MDPHSTIMSAFQTATNLAEIWPYHHLLDHTTNHAATKRRDDDESAIGVSTSGNALVYISLLTSHLLHYLI